MKRATVTAASARRRGRAAPRHLFKADRPRAIDRYIDYFGDRSWGDDVCGERLLDALAGHEGGRRHVRLAG